MMESKNDINASVDNEIEFTVSFGEETEMFNASFNNTLSKVAYTGDFNDLENKPDIGDLTPIKEQIKSVSDKVDKISVPTKTSQITNDSGFITSAYHDATKQNVITDLESIRSGASKGATALQSVPDTYAKKTDLPSLNGYATESWVNGKGYITNIKTINNQSLIGTGNITISGGGGTTVTKLSELENDVGFITDAYHDSTKQNTITDLATIRSGASLGATALQSIPNTYAKKTDIPSLDGYALKTDIPSLSGYATESWVSGQGFLKEHQSLNGYATQTWVNEQGFLKLGDLVNIEGNTY